MKHILVVTLIAICFQSFGSGRIALEYKVNSDNLSDTITEGYTIVIGKVYIGYPSDISSFGINEGVVSTVDHKFRGTTGKTGKFMLRIPSDKIALYFFKPGYREIVTSQYDFKSKHIVEVDFYGKDERQNINVKKPVVYLYPEKELEMSIVLHLKGEMTFTYPKYDNGWKVIASPEGVVKDYLGHEYPYLFWEAEQKELTYMESELGFPGFIVSQKDVIHFLEEQLSNIGLNGKEMTDFITFWGPIMQRNKFAFVQFLIDEDYDNKVGTITTVPRMQTVKRIYLLCSGINSKDDAPAVISQSFVPFERLGSTLVEWGGSEIKLIRQTN
jgi:hypothetical protein